jgi:uncharacterized membrane protein YvlD (DUF360 family)
MNESERRLEQSSPAPVHWLLADVKAGISRNVSFSKRELAFDVATLLACAALFSVNNALVKPSVASLPAAVRLLANGHFNDFLGGIAFLAYTNILFDLVKPGYRIRRLWACLAYIFLCGVFWETVAPLFIPRSVGDPYDLIAYALGGAVYWALSTAVLRTSRR